MVILFTTIVYIMLLTNARPSMKVTMTSNIDQLSIKRTEKGDALKLTGNFTFNFNLFAIIQYSNHFNIAR